MTFLKKSMMWIGVFSFLSPFGLVAQTIQISQLKSQKHEVIQTFQSKESNLSAFEKLTWETDIEKAFSRAKKEKKNVMLLIQDPRCKWCKKMKEETLSDPRVQEKLKAYILLKAERKDQKTVKKIEEFTGAIPSFYFMQPDREIFESVIGYFQAEDFLQFLVEIEEEN
ncbi:MAG: hypothetical protein RL113_1231 [Pseudomonadota bacterium]